MSTININMSDLESVDESPTTLPIVVEDILLKKAESGVNYLEWQLRITSELHKDRSLRHITSLSTAARRHLRDLFRAFGIEGEEVTLEFDDQEVREVYKGKRYTRIDRHLISPDLIDRAAVATVINGSYKDQPQVRVVKLLPPA